MRRIVVKRRPTQPEGDTSAFIGFDTGVEGGDTTVVSLSAVQEGVVREVGRSDLSEALSRTILNMGTVTSRMSSDSPNLSNIPRSGEATVHTNEFSTSIGVTTDSVMRNARVDTGRVQLPLNSNPASTAFSISLTEVHTDRDIRSMEVVVYLRFVVNGARRDHAFRVSTSLLGQAHTEREIGDLVTRAVSDCIYDIVDSALIPNTIQEVGRVLTQRGRRYGG